MHARAKSNPRDLLGSIEAGAPYVLDESSLGDKGTREAKLLVGLLTSRGGIWRERPRPGKFGLLGVLGEAKPVSSLALGTFSLNAGDGERVGLGASDNDRGFDEDRNWEGALRSSGTSCVCFEICFGTELLCDGSPCEPNGTVVVEDIVGGIKHNPAFSVSMQWIILLSRYKSSNGGGLKSTVCLVGLVLVSDHVISSWSWPSQAIDKAFVTVST